jgi:ABC-type uncharacterized transport system auxiliary subunit
MHRRSIVLLPLLLAASGCSILPDRPYVPTRRFAMDLRRPGDSPGRRGRRTLLLRMMRAAPDLERRGLRSVMPDGSVSVDFYDEWVAPPVELAEEVARRWLDSSGLFAAVVSPGTRARIDLILEIELTTLHAEPGAGLARAGLAAILLREGNVSGDIMATFSLEGLAPMPRAGASGAVPAETRAAAMASAFGMAMTELEGRLRSQV